ncbi:unnamed protein product [Toxocara canis]|uniref:General transcription factor 3C polypeptide 1 n=2 Tax=Toxocara canis TaxID=6265 RepID=A0A183UAR4_TOXCA|nr:unnamed protein product [Toxocara canis]
MSGKANRKRRKRVEEDDEDYVVTDDDECEDEADVSISVWTMFVPYSKEEWSPLYLYRTLADLTASSIRQSGSEGVGRVEVGRSYGIDTTVKSGNRRVSGWITNAIKAYPDYFGHFQKMEGRYRSIRYFWKVNAQPERFSTLFNEWQRVTDVSCPFTIGQVIKFPKANLNTLRISDVSLRRLIDMLRLVKENRIVVTMHRFMKSIIELEQGYGYQYQIDKKSVLKCVYALQKAGFVHLFEKVVVDENASSKVELICDTSIQSVDDPAVDAALRATINEFHDNGRVFPRGQLRLSRRRLEEQQHKSKTSSSGSNDIGQEELEKLEEDNFAVMTVDKRLGLIRLQSIRRALIQPSKVDEAETGGEPDDESHTEECLAEESGEEPDTVRSSCNSKDKTSKWDKKESSDVGKREKTYRFHFDPSINYGHQSKMIKCYILHQLVYHFVYGLPEGTKPTIYERFPPSKPMACWEDNKSIDDCPVYVDDESPFRFVPPVPQFQGLPRGWFILQDLVNALPLSILALTVRMKRRCETVEELLRDPLKRHMLVLDLPQEVRLHLLHDKRALRQIEHLLLTMCGLGLLRVAPNPDAKRYPMAGAQFFFVMHGGVLRDTSTSDRGYACVTPPIDQYKLYDYSFDSLQDIRLYWHHFRAIVQSTPLAFRLGVPAEDTNPARIKKYAMGVTDKTDMIKCFDDVSVRADPLSPQDGCAGFDSALFVHLRRHWDVNPRPSDMVSWFMVDWRRSAEMAKPVVDARVERLQKTWNSYIKSLMPSDIDLWKKNKVDDESVVRHCHGSLAVESKKIRTRNVRIERKKMASAKRSKKRPMDSVDLISEQRRIHMRSRFSAKERDMVRIGRLLVLIRAVGFFLNPVYRFWLDPTVLRDVMHEYVPESRTKTVQSLMAAGVREMVRPNKITYLQRIVRNLTSFKEMRVLRSQLATQPLSDPLAKRQFFIKAFNMATRLLFMETTNMPSTSVSDEHFEKFLNQGKVTISTETQQSMSFPMRSLKPTDLNQIRHCVAFNVVMSMLLCEEDLTDLRLERLIEQLSACSLSNVLEQLRVDGLIAKQRPQSVEVITNRSTKNQATLSYYFRHFFNHRFHLEIVEQTNAAFEQVARGESITTDDRPGMIVAAISCFYSDLLLDLTMPDDLLSVFDTGLDQLANATKRLRYLESADLHLEKIVITPMRESQPQPSLPSLDELISSMKKVIPRGKMGAISFDDFLCGYPVDQRPLLRIVQTAVSAAGIYGASLQDVKKSVLNGSEENIKWALNEMEKDAQVVLVGVDCPRYVVAANASCWMLNGEMGSFFCSPWTTLAGDIHRSTVRWMMEGILFSIVNRPGGTLDELKGRFAFALQPRMVGELVNLLECYGCVRVCSTNVKPIRLKSPFDRSLPEELMEYILPAVDCMERFAKMFHSVQLSEMLTSNRVEYV